jgi:hypothetical protein
MKTLFLSAALCLVFTFTTSASAQKLSLAPRPVQFSLGLAKSGDTLLCSRIYVNIQTDKKILPLQTNLFALYAEDASSFFGTIESENQRNALGSFQGVGVAALWDLSGKRQVEKMQIGLGLGRYMTASRSSAINRSGWGGRMFVRIPTRKYSCMDYMEIAHVIPVTNRFAITTVGFGVRF